MHVLIKVHSCFLSFKVRQCRLRRFPSGVAFLRLLLGLLGALAPCARHQFSSATAVGTPTFTIRVATCLTK